MLEIAGFGKAVKRMFEAVEGGCSMFGSSLDLIGEVGCVIIESAVY